MEVTPVPRHSCSPLARNNNPEHTESTRAELVLRLTTAVQTCVCKAQVGCCLIGPVVSSGDLGLVYRTDMLIV